MNPATERTNVTDTGYSYGGKAYEYATRLDANNQPYRVDVLAGTAPAWNTAPTVISNETKQKQVGDMSTALDGITQGQGVRTDAQGNATYANGTIYQTQTQPTTEQTQVAVKETTYTGADGIERNSETGQPAKIPGTAQATGDGFFVDSATGKKYNAPAGDTSGLDKQAQQIADEIKSRADAETASRIDSIKAQMARLISQQEESNASFNAKTQNVLLTGGVTGKGSSSQYAPISSDNLVKAQVNYGLQKVADLVSQQQELIAQAEAARYNKNYPDLERKLALIEDKKNQVQAEAKKISDRLIAETQKKNEAKFQATRDNAIAELFSQGIMDSTELLKELNKSGGDFTLKEINEGLSNIAKTIGFDDGKDLTVEAREFYKLREAGELPQSILQLPTDAEQMNAYLQNKAIAKKAPANVKTTSPKAVVTSGGLKYSAQDQAEDSKVLEASRGADHYVDPTIYENLYKAWVANGGLLKDFLTKFPPKNYVNPANDWLPIFLRPAQTKTSGAKTTIDEI